MMRGGCRGGEVEVLAGEGGIEEANSHTGDSEHIRTHTDTHAHTHAHTHIQMHMRPQHTN